MHEVLKKRVLPFFLGVVLCFSVVSVSVLAAGSGIGASDSLDIPSVAAWEGKAVNANSAFVSAFCVANGIPVSSTGAFWYFVNQAIETTGYGEVSYDQLLVICKQFNNAFNGNSGGVWEAIFKNCRAFITNSIALCFGLSEMNFVIEEWGTSGIYRIRESKTGLWIVNSSGQYACAEATVSGTESGGNKWVGEGTVTNGIGSSAKVIMQDYNSLAALNALLIDAGINSQLRPLGTKYYGIWYNRQFYCNENGYPFVCSKNEAEWAINQSRPDTSVKDENGEDVDEDLPGDNQTNIDLSGMTITLPNGNIMIADQIIYDESTKTYHIDSHDTYNIYNTYYYTWNYYINYTSITYIGQTEEYNKYYEVYYELPDGRDSADLTAAEVEQLSVSLDCANYARVTDDVSLRSLYHFDGDTHESSFWNYCTSFTWNQGASLTYMDAGAFNGALYLDETYHSFTVKLPSGFRSDDFTVQFRYYQSYTAAPKTDSYVQLGGTKVLQFTGAQFLTGTGTVLAATSVGTWNEIAIIRSGGSLFYYLNGLRIGSVTALDSYNDTITFCFGANQQTFKYFDELRVTNYALARYGASYTCSSVPYDTNLSLVLPDSVAPVADEYWSFDKTITPFRTWDFINGGSGLIRSVSGGTPVNSTTFSYVPSSGSGSKTYTNTAQLNSSGLTLYSQYPWSSSSSLEVNLSSLLSKSTDGGDTNVYQPYVGFTAARLSSSLGSYPYTFSIVTLDGRTYSLTVTSSSRFWYKDFGTFYLCARSYTSDNGSTYYMGFTILPKPGVTFAGIIYAEVVPGSTPNTDHKWVTEVVPLATLEKPTLAVKTDIEITSYQIGGVRPTYPQKGQVWALVESGFIRSLQVYTGSAWEAVDGRIWTGERWIPYSSYNVITLQDMYDVVDATGDYEYIYTEQGFWSWWQKSWNSFIERFFALDFAGGSGGGSAGTKGFWDKIKDAVTNGLATLIEGVFDLITEVLKSLIGAAIDLLAGIFGFLTSTVLGGISDFFGSFGDLVSPFQTPVANEDGSITTTTGLPEGIPAVFAFFSGVVMVMPSELRSILLFGIGLMLLLAVFRIVKE